MAEGSYWSDIKTLFVLPRLSLKFLLGINEKNLTRVHIWRQKDTMPIQNNPTKFKNTGNSSRTLLDEISWGYICECSKAPRWASLGSQLSPGLVPICYQEADSHHSTATFLTPFHLMSVSHEPAAGQAQALWPQEQRDAGKMHTVRDSIWLLVFFSSLVTNSISWAKTTACSKAETEFCFDLEYLHI